jgi:hypothetical protein
MCVGKWRNEFLELRVALFLSELTLWRTLRAQSNAWRCLSRR